MRNLLLLITLAISLVQGCATQEKKPIFDANLETVKSLLSQGEDVNNTNDSATPLYYAAKNNRIKVVKFLLKKGAHINKGTQSSTPLSVALEYENEEVVNYLIEKGASVSAALFFIGYWAVGQDILPANTDFENQLNSAKKLKKLGANVDLQLEFYGNNTALHGAVLGGSLDLVKHYLDNGAKENIINKKRQTPRMLGYVSKYTDIRDYFENLR
ncbi:MAG: ankyrin repeat domain-containing protein [Deltaproteobacteria bacterium]|nr:ankyrin repeat domain-containing protein [Deltaproteobacteria bacterium]